MAFSRARKLLIICGDLEFFYNYDDPNNKFIEIIDYIKTNEHCKIIPCNGGCIFWKKLIDDLYYNVVPINDGYLYLFTDDVFVPIYDTSLLITKRIVMPINLVEEKILQLLNLGITQIDEISQILGLNRRLLEVTLADLYSKNLISVSSNACTMLIAGKEALNKLNRTEKKQDILKNIYMDGVLGEIIDFTNLELVDNLRNDDAKLHPVFEIGDLRLYNNCFEKISQIFMQENKMFYLCCWCTP